MSSDSPVTEAGRSEQSQGEERKRPLHTMLLSHARLVEGATGTSAAVCADISVGDVISFCGLIIEQVCFGEATSLYRKIVVYTLLW